MSQRRNHAHKRPARGTVRRGFLHAAGAAAAQAVVCAGDPSGRLAAAPPPAADLESGHRSVSVCHLGNISCRLGRPLKWDPVAETFISDAEADGLLSRPQRPGFEVRA